MKFLSKVAQPQKTIIIVVATVILVPIILFIGLVIYRIPAAFERADTEEAINFIQSQKLTMADVTGENLPPVPDPKLVDATVEGIDANNNLIRDDVELAIFEKYPDDAVIRSAMLQYAMGLQMELTQVFNSETWVAAVEESERGSICVIYAMAALSSKQPSTMNDEEFSQYSEEIDRLQAELEELFYNTDLRKQRRDEVIEFIASFGDSDKPEDCDIDPESILGNKGDI